MSVFIVVPHDAFLMFWVFFGVCFVSSSCPCSNGGPLIWISVPGFGRRFQDFSHQQYWTHMDSPGE